MAFYGGISVEQLRQVVERIERLDEEKKNIGEDIKQVFSEAKSNGYDVKTIRTILKLRKIDDNDLQEQEYLLDTYKRALGMLPELDGDDVYKQIAQRKEENKAAEATTEPGQELEAADAVAA